MLVIDTLPTPSESLVGYTFRPAHQGDVRATYQLLLDCEAADQRGYVDSLEDRQRDFDNPFFNIEKDTLLAITDEGQVTGMAWIIAPPAGETEFIAFLWGEVHPQHRGRGLGDYLLSWMEARGRQILAGRPTDLPHFLRTSCLDYNTDRVALFEQHGFEHVRSAYRMRRDLALPIPEGLLPPGVRLRLWSPELDVETLETCNDAFRDHWGYIPFNEEAWRLFMSGHQDFRPELSPLAMANDPATGLEQVIGFSINRVHAEENQHNGIQEGWIAELGVRRPWRQQGIATSLLCESMRLFKEAGLEYAGLGVDTENTTGALRIYERLGFQAVRRFVTYSRPV